MAAACFAESKADKGERTTKDTPTAARNTSRPDGALGAGRRNTPDGRCSRYTIMTKGGSWIVNDAASELLAAAPRQSIPVFALPANAQITALRIKHSAPFTGPGLTGAAVSLGTSAAADIYAPAFDVFQPAAGTAFYDDGGAFAADSAAHGVLATFTAKGANLNALAGGSVDIWACWRTLP